MNNQKIKNEKQIENRKQLEPPGFIQARRGAKHSLKR